MRGRQLQPKDRSLLWHDKGSLRCQVHGRIFLQGVLVQRRWRQLLLEHKQHDRQAADYIHGKKNLLGTTTSSPRHASNARRLRPRQAPRHQPAQSHPWTVSLWGPNVCPRPPTMTLRARAKQNAPNSMSARATCCTGRKKTPSRSARASSSPSRSIRSKSLRCAGPPTTRSAPNARRMILAKSSKTSQPGSPSAVTSTRPATGSVLRACLASIQR